MSISQRTVPASIKLAHVVPTFKGGDTHEVENYKPISVLSVASKLLERLITNRILSFLNSFDFFNTFQYGFRKNSNTRLVATKLINFTCDELKKKKDVCLGIFIDL